MELSKQVGAFTLVPEYDGNRDLPESERLSLTIKPLRRLDLMAQMGWLHNPDEVYRWRDEELKQWINNPAYGKEINQLPLELLIGMRQFVGQTSEFRNFLVEGRALEDPAEVFLNIAGETGDTTLIGEIQDAITQTAILNGDELKNFVRQCGGSSNEIEKDAVTAG